MSEKTPLFYRYHFVFDSDHAVDIKINLDPETLQFIPSDKQPAPYWARFDYLVCEGCHLNISDQSFCPVAVNIASVIKAFKDAYSYDVVDVTVETQDRMYAKLQVPIQQPLSSLLGIIMVTSGCENLDKLRPMAKYHLPFASTEETIYRATSMYLLAQYLRYKKGLKPDWDMTELVDIYDNIDQINANICKRLQEASKKDASLNAVVILDVFAQMISTSFEYTLKDFEYLFAPYLEQ